MTEQDSGTQVLVDRPPVARRDVTDAETLRVLADPLRIALLRVLMTEADVRPRVMSAKELAAELGEPQTKLYRHLKQLEEAKLIEVAETRVVSGITEQRYRTAQVHLGLSAGLLEDPSNRGAMADTVAATFADFSDELRRHIRAGRVSVRSNAGEDSVGGVLHSGSVRRMNPERARQLRDKLAEIIAELDAVGEEPDGVPVNWIIGLYGVTDAGAA